MGILSQVRKFLKKYLSNPLIAAGVAYLIVKIIMSNKKEILNFCEDIKRVYKDKDFEIIFDSVEDIYLLIDGRGIHNNIIKLKDKADGLAQIKKLKATKNSRNSNMRERLDILHEEIKNYTKYKK